MDLYLDLDGTVVDIAERYYRLYANLTKGLGGKPMGKRAYWLLKVAGLGEEEIFSYRVPEASKSQRHEYAKHWKKLLEDQQYLQYDSLFPGVSTVLELLNRVGHRLFLLAERENPGNALHQLDRFKIINQFHEIVFVSDDKEKPWRPGAHLIKQWDGFQREHSLIIGDTETEILLGKHLNIPTAAVLTGLRNQNHLLKYEPDFVLDRLDDLPRVVKVLEGEGP